MLATAAVRGLAPYVIGKPISELARELGLDEGDIIKLASNENPLGPSPLALQSMQRALADVWLYPDGNGHDLKQALAQRHGVAMSQVTLGNGSNDLLVLLAEAFLTPQVNAVYSQYAFAIYGLTVQATGAQARVAPAFGAGHPMELGHDLDAMLERIDADTRLVYIANPNNPTGTWNTPAQVAAFLARVPVDGHRGAGRSLFRIFAPRGLPRWHGPVRGISQPGGAAHLFQGACAGWRARGLCNLASRRGRCAQSCSPALQRQHSGHGRRAGQHHRCQPGAARRAVGGRRRSAAACHASRAGSKAVSRRRATSCWRMSGSTAAPFTKNCCAMASSCGRWAGYGLPRCLRITFGTAAQNEKLIAALAAVLRE